LALNAESVGRSGPGGEVARVVRGRLVEEMRKRKEVISRAEESVRTNAAEVERAKELEKQVGMIVVALL